LPVGGPHKKSIERIYDNPLFVSKCDLYFSEGSHFDLASELR
jgi:hypothetical protein